MGLQRNPSDDKLYFVELLDNVQSLASGRALAKQVHDEVIRALTSDPDFQILVREGVREAMAKLNIAEVVEAAVALALAKSQIEK
jgi:hypothetical protein